MNCEVNATEEEKQVTDQIEQLSKEVFLPLFDLVRDTIVTHKVMVGAPAVAMALGKALGLTTCSINNEEGRRMLMEMAFTQAMAAQTKTDKFVKEHDRG